MGALQGQWADSLLAAERLFATKLLAWGLISLLVGSTLLAVERIRGVASPIVRHFAIQSALWGGAAAAFAIRTRSAAQLRDLASAVALDRALSFEAGLSIGIAASAVVIAGNGQREARPALVGGGAGIAVQGVAFAWLAVQLSGAIVR